MDIVIKIPKEFEKDFNEDRFEDCLARLASDIEAFGFRLAGRYEKETVTMLRKAFKNATPLPKDHGALKDVDELIENIRRLPNAGMRWFVNAESVFDVLLNAPTIIEADKEKEE